MKDIWTTDHPLLTIVAVLLLALVVPALIEAFL